MASTYLTKTSTTVTDDKKLTISTWVKGSDLNTSVQAGAFGFRSTTNNGNNNFQFGIFNSGFYVFYASNNGADVHISKVTNALLRDVNGWYNLVVAVDSTQATASDRVKMYINGELQTSFSIDTNPPLNRTFLNSTCNIDVGRFTYTNGTHKYWNGSQAHFHFIDGTAYDASAFGETDATTGIWKPKTAPSVTYGTNGFFLKFENSGAFGTDSSGNANNFTVNGTMTQTIDTPSNVFATWNPLFKSDLSYSNGNLSTGNTTASHNTTVSTLAVTKGKWYWEVKHTQLNSSNKVMVGILGTDNGDGYTDFCGNQATGYGYYSENGSKYNNASPSSYAASYTAGDIISVAFDADNGTLWYGKNGTWLNSATQTEIENGTTTNAAFSGIDTSIGFYAGCSNEDCNSTANFGNGYFGTTAVSSAQNPDDGIGIFEYDVPAGYRALCTKSINAEEYS